MDHLHAGRSERSERLDRLLDDDEDLLWHGKPRKAPLYAGAALSTVLLLVFGGFFLGPFLVPVGVGLVVLLGAETGLATTFGVGLFGILSFVALMAWMAHRRHELAEYAVTDDRVLSFSGVVGRDYSSVPWQEVQDLEVNVGVKDRIFSTGTVCFQVAGSDSDSGLDFTHIPTPYEILNDLEDARAAAR